MKDLRLFNQVLNIEYRIKRVQEETAAVKSALKRYGTVSNARLEALDKVLLKLEELRQEIRNGQ